jgi:N-acetylmuramoyl-L-alanine amidase
MPAQRPAHIAEAAIEQPALLAPPREAEAPADAPIPTAIEPEAEKVEPVVPAAPRAAPIRIAKPAIPEGPRRIGLQVGHWKTEEVPPELRRLEAQTGTSGGGVNEWQLNLDIANRAATQLRARGYEVDIIPTLLPTNYLADVFVSLHADGDPAGAARGFKAAHGSRRGPHEGRLVQALVEEYGKATGLPQDDRISRNMLGYYAFSWSRYEWSAAPHTPAAILEMGFMTSAADRVVLLQRRDVVAQGVVNGILRFLDEVPQSAIFGEDLIVTPQPQRNPQPQVAAPAPARG